jgi:glycosyltransferase involved in cell wall biosynthesis
MSSGTSPRLLVLSYAPDKPSYRYRIQPLVARLEGRGWQCSVDTLPLRSYYWRMVQRRVAIRAADVILLHKLRLAPWETRWLCTRGPATVFDVDDATWLSQPAAGEAPAAPASRAQAFAQLCRSSTLTMAGSRHLAERAAAAGARVELVPTAVDVAACPAADLDRRGGATAVWIGLPGNLQYLDVLRPALAEVARRHPGFRLRIVSSVFPDWNDVPLECVPWQPGIETTEALTGADIGLMPLADDAFTRGKCAFKLLQYMAASLACIASPVGANVDVVTPGVNGLLAASPADWVAAFDRLLSQRPLRDAMGLAGRERVLRDYDSRVVIPRAASLVEALAGRTAGQTFTGRSTNSISDA